MTILSLLSILPASIESELPSHLRVSLREVRILHQEADKNTEHRSQVACTGVGRKRETTLVKSQILLYPDP